MSPKVRFTRAGVVEVEIALEPGDYRLGRASDNDIVLRDPDKTLSRHHAELRFDGTQWFYLDLNSANGSWVDGAQVTRQALDRDLTIHLGDYELKYQREPRKGEDTAPDVDATRMIPVGNLQDLAGVAVAAGRGRDTAIIGKAVPSAAAEQGNKAPANTKAGWSPLRRILIFGWLTVFGVFAVMIAAMLRPESSNSNATTGTPETAATSVTPAVTSAPAASAEPAATAPVSQPATAAAPETPPSGAPSAASASPVAATQPQGTAATAPAAPPRTVPGGTPKSTSATPTASASPTTAPATATASRGATLPPGWVPATGSTAATPRRPPRAADADADATALPAEPGESPAALKARRDRVRVRYDMALQRLAAQQYGEARTLLAEVSAEAPGFRDVSARLAEAETGLRQQFKQAADAAAKHEQAAEWTEALRAYEAMRPFAAALPELEPAIAKTRTRMNEAGIEALTRARQFDSRGRMPEAIAWYQRAVAWLPPDHAGLDAARQRLAQLGGRP